MRKSFETGPAMLGAASGDDLVPDAFRVWGAFVGPNDRLRVLVTSHAPRTQDNLRSNGRIAVTFTDIQTFRSVQVKGAVDGTIDAPDRTDVDVLRAYHERFCANLLTSATPSSVADRLRPMSVFAVWVRVEELYDQTPGGVAGARFDPEAQ